MVFGTPWVDGPLSRATAVYEFPTRLGLCLLTERMVCEISLLIVRLQDHTINPSKGQLPDRLDFTILLRSEQPISLK